MHFLLFLHFTLASLVNPKTPSGWSKIQDSDENIHHASRGFNEKWTSNDCKEERGDKPSEELWGPIKVETRGESSAAREIKLKFTPGHIGGNMPKSCGHINPRSGYQKNEGCKCQVLCLSMPCKGLFSFLAQLAARWGSLSMGNPPQRSMITEGHAAVNGRWSPPYEWMAMIHWAVFL